jgi:tripartite-type tricarboxylate transporter receptor subunit TctC
MLRRTLLAAPLLAATPLNAQERYPNRPIRLIVPVAVAGASDIVARILADGMAPLLGRPVVVENVVGGGSTVGASAFQRAPADGYTIFLATNNHAQMKAVYPQFAYDPVSDFIPLALVSRQPFVLAVNPNLPAHNVPQLLEWLRVRREAANFGATNPGANNHMAGELLRQRAGVQFTIVPYRAAAASVQDLVAGRLDFTIESPTLLLPLIRAGQVRGLAVSSAEPSPLVPELPSLQQAGVPDYDMTVWTILFARPGTPPEVIATLRDSAARALRDPALVQRLAAAGSEVWPDRGPPAAELLLKAEIERWTPIIQSMNLSPP